METAVREWLQMLERHFFRAGIFKLVPKWGMRILVLGD
jgi:hypothetical protein